MADDLEVMAAAYADWKDAVPLTENNAQHKASNKPTDGEAAGGIVPNTLTGIMQRVLAFPIESRSPIESMTFLADIKRQLAEMI